MPRAYAPRSNTARTHPVRTHPPHAETPRQHPSSRPRNRSPRPAAVVPVAFPELVETIVDPDAPVPSFAELGLPKALVTALDRQGIDAPFPIQAATIPDILHGHDVLGRGQTGSGKTLAFGLPMLARIAGKTAAPRQPLALVLVPTRELAMQVHDALEPMGHSLGLRLRLVVGGMSMGKQIDGLRRGAEVVVATPGRLTDLINQRACQLGDVEIVVLDEADHMADMGFLPAVTALLDQVRPGGQRLLFSATLDGDVATLVRRYLVEPVSHSTAPATAGVSTMDHHLLVVEARDKVAVATEIANRVGRTILFVRTKHGVDRLTRQLRQAGVVAGGLHGGKNQGVRTRTLAEFRDGALGVLVATDVAARGIHVDGIDLVLHIDPPADHKDYLHRAGRTARAGESGSVVTLVTPEQRREVDRMTVKAGITTTCTKATPGDAEVARITGARPATGAALPEHLPTPAETPRRRHFGAAPVGGRGNLPAGGGRGGSPRGRSGGPSRHRAG